MDHIKQLNWNLHTIWDAQGRTVHYTGHTATVRLGVTGGWEIIENGKRVLEAAGINEACYFLNTREAAIDYGS